MMRKPRAQPIAMFLNKCEGITRWAFWRKKGLAQKGAHGALAFIALLRVDCRLQRSEPFAPPTRSIRKRWR
jgi:hypothetical protein